MLMGSYGQSVVKRLTGRRDAANEELNRHHDAIIGLERRLAREALGEGAAIARSALTRHYAAFAADMVQRMGGDVRGLKALTDRNNIVPLAGGSPACCADD